MVFVGLPPLGYSKTPITLGCRLWMLYGTITFTIVQQVRSAIRRHPAYALPSAEISSSTAAKSGVVCGHLRTSRWLGAFSISSQCWTGIRATCWPGGLCEQPHNRLLHRCRRGSNRGVTSYRGIFNTDQGSQFTDSRLHAACSRITGSRISMDGKGALARQRHGRALLAINQIRGGLSARLRQRLGSQAFHRPLHQLLQRTALSLVLEEK